jgi:uncharacterized protein (DUF983 family)
MTPQELEELNEKIKMSFNSNLTNNYNLILIIVSFVVCFLLIRHFYKDIKTWKNVLISILLSLTISLTISFNDFL